MDIDLVQTFAKYVIEVENSNQQIVDALFSHLVTGLVHCENIGDLIGFRDDEIMQRKTYFWPTIGEKQAEMDQFVIQRMKQLDGDKYRIEISNKGKWFIFNNDFIKMTTSEYLSPLNPDTWKIVPYIQSKSYAAWYVTITRV